MHVRLTEYEHPRDLDVEFHREHLFLTHRAAELSPNCHLLSRTLEERHLEAV